jgi:hypothetical protein
VANKGGVCVKFRLLGTTLCFIGSHLAAHEGVKKIAKRNADCTEVLRGCRVGLKWMDAATQFDHCFFLGDLNYRVDLRQTDGVERSHESHVSEVIRCAEQYKSLQSADQLYREVMAKRVLVGFAEGKLDYAPTFKVQRGPGLAYDRKRVPSYCDRILWRSKPGLQADHRQEWVRPVPALETSDHKPLTSYHLLKIRKEKSLVPAAAAADYEGVTLALTNLHASHLTAMDSNGLSDPYCVFVCPHLLGKAAAPRTATLKKTLHPTWANGEVPLLRCLVDDIAEVRGQTLLIAVWDYDRGTQDELIGTATLPLGPHCDAAGLVDFELDLVADGQFHGTLAGRLQLRLPPGHPPPPTPPRASIAAPFHYRVLDPTQAAATLGADIEYAAAATAGALPELRRGQVLVVDDVAFSAAGVRRLHTVEPGSLRDGWLCARTPDGAQLLSRTTKAAYDVQEQRERRRPAAGARPAAQRVQRRFSLSTASSMASGQAAALPLQQRGLVGAPKKVEVAVGLLGLTVTAAGKFVVALPFADVVPASLQLFGKGKEVGFGTKAGVVLR